MRSVVFTSLFALILTSSLAVDARAQAGAASAKPATPASGTTAPSPAAGMRTVNDKDLKSLKTLNEKYQTAALVSMDVAKTLKLGLLDQERKSKGKVHLSKGQMRMELEGAEKSLLIVNKKNLWAVTFPPAEFKDAAVQVIRGDTTSKKARAQALTGLLASGGFLKHFKPTAVQTEASGEMVYFLQPLVATSEFKRAQLRVSKDVKQINELRYWDEKDNETRFEFSGVTFGKKADAKLFDYKPPANADIMNL